MRRRVVRVLAAVSLAAACSSGGATPRLQDASDPTRGSVEAEGLEPSPQPSAPAGSTPTSAVGSAAPTPQEAETSSPTSQPSFRELAMDISVTPECVALGGTAELRVTSDHGVQVVWGAVYDGGEGGADPPFGSGHGGTGSGIVGDDGTYVARWTVRPSAPAGPAIVIVQAGYGDRYGYREIPFEVVTAAARC